MTRFSRLNWALIGAGLLIALIAAGLLLSKRQERDRIMRADPETILANHDLAPIAIAMGRAGFATHCASCHGTGKGDPRRGVPDLTDADYLYGEGQVAEIEAIILHGIRSGDPRGWNLADMPAYSRVRPYPREPIAPLQPAQIEDVTQFLMQLRGKATDVVAATRGTALFKGSGGCWDCHGPDGGGDTAIGAPSLVDDVWLYGDGSPAGIKVSIANGRGGRSPAFNSQLSATDARAIAVYVAALSRHQNKDHRGE